MQRKSGRIPLRRIKALNLRRFSRSRRDAGVPAFRRKADSTAYSLSEAHTWTCEDRHSSVSNPMVSIRLPGDFLILRDANGTARFVLKYYADGHHVVIDSIQRERTQYIADRFAHVLPYAALAWDPKGETRESQQFGKQLGMHPSEFLVSEFLWRFRTSIRRGIKVYLKRNLVGQPLQTLTDRARIYGGIRDRFFKSKKETIQLFGGLAAEAFELSRDKQRVLEILGRK